MDTSMHTTASFGLIAPGHSHDEGTDRHALRNGDDDLDRAVAVPERATLRVRRRALARCATRRWIGIEDTQRASAPHFMDPQGSVAASAHPLPRVDPDRTGPAYDFDLAPDQLDVDAIDRCRPMGR